MFLKVTDYKPMNAVDFYRSKNMHYTGPAVEGYSVKIDNFEFWINKINFDKAVSKSADSKAAKKAEVKPEVKAPAKEDPEESTKSKKKTRKRKQD